MVYLYGQSWAKIYSMQNIVRLQTWQVASVATLWGTLFRALWGASNLKYPDTLAAFENTVLIKKAKTFLSIHSPRPKRTSSAQLVRLRIANKSCKYLQLNSSKLIFLKENMYTRPSTSFFPRINVPKYRRKIFIAFYIQAQLREKPWLLTSSFQGISCVIAHVQVAWISILASEIC